MPNQQQPTPWHSLPVREALSRLRSDERGLSAAEAASRLREYGPNVLPEKGATPAWRIVLRQFASPLIYILVAAAVVSILIGDVKDAGFIAAVLAINAVIGAYQEWHAEQSSQALRKLLHFHAQVERDGEIQELSADELTPGDVVWLESGHRVPADIRLLSSQGLEVDESLLTGESLAVDKDANWSGAESTPVADRRNMAFAGALVARGRGKGLVVATGAATIVGQLALDVMAGTGGKPPLVERMERFTNKVAIGTVGASAIIGLLSLTISQHSLVKELFARMGELNGSGTLEVLKQFALVDTFFLMVALAVSAIPEGLPVAMTVALSVATTRMARRNVIVRRLAAVEGLGSCTLIATDKTGTLTCNELTVREVRLRDEQVIEVTGEGFAPVGQALLDGSPARLGASPLLDSAIEASVLCNESDLHHRDGAWVWRGDSVDVALLSLGQKLGLAREAALERLPQVNRIPFESEHQFSASFHDDKGRTVVFVKGAPERVLAMCQGRTSAEENRQFEDVALDMARRGLRVLALARGTLDGLLQPSDAPPAPSGLEWLGLVGMIDPLRAGARDAVEQCHEAGVAVSMVTGDHRVTALAIARDLGLAEREDQVVTATEIDGKSEQELAEIVERTRVFARVTPRQKLQIVTAARGSGHYVAVTGDGVNDAPALRAANIGVAMGRGGTDVAREAAELVISDDDFRSIVGGIEEGRVAYDNIRKVIYLLVSMGAAELLMVFLAVVAGLPVPLLPVQLLWLNLVTNGIQGVALAFEPNEGDALQRPPRPPGEQLFNRLMIERIIIAAVVCGGGGFAVYDIALRMGLPLAEARNLLLLVMVLFENFQVGNSRSETKSAFALSPLRSPILFFGTLGAFAIHVAGMHLPFMQTMLATAPVSASEWAWMIGIALSIIPAIELHKWWWGRRAGRPTKAASH